MAGKYLEFTYPGYATLTVRDLPYLAGSGDDSDVNPFRPDSSRPLVEGEFLEFSASGGSPRFTRGGDNVETVADTPDGEGSVPAFPYFMEQGRYDSQVIALAHCAVGPLGFEFRTKLCKSTGMSVNSKVSVWDWKGRSGAFGLVRRVLALHSAGWVVGRVSRIYGTDDIAVVFGLQ